MEKDQLRWGPDIQLLCCSLHQKELRWRLCRVQWSTSQDLLSTEGFSLLDWEKICCQELFLFLFHLISDWNLFCEPEWHQDDGGRCQVCAGQCFHSGSRVSAVHVPRRSSYHISDQSGYTNCMLLCGNVVTCYRQIVSFVQDCLSIFGGESHVTLEMSYDGEGHPLRLLWASAFLCACMCVCLLYTVYRHLVWKRTEFWRTVHFSRKHRKRRWTLTSLLPMSPTKSFWKWGHQFRATAPSRFHAGYHTDICIPIAHVPRSLAKPWYCCMQVWNLEFKKMNGSSFTGSAMLGVDVAGVEEWKTGPLKEGRKGLQWGSA